MIIRTISGIYNTTKKQCLDSFLEKQTGSDFAEAFYRPDLILVKGTRDWDLKGVSAAGVELQNGNEKKFTLKGKLVATAADYSAYNLVDFEFAWK